MQNTKNFPKFTLFCNFFLSGIYSDLSPPPFGAIFQKQEGNILSVFQIPYRKKGIFKENRKKISQNKGDILKG